MILNYINYNTLTSDSIKLAKTIKRKYDLVIGIPRSGLIPASIIAFSLGVPVITTYEFLNRELFKFGIKKTDIKNVLIVDDSITSGNTLKNVLIKLKKNYSDINFHTAILYTDRPDIHNLDYTLRIVPAFRVFQWNIFNHGHLKHACIDMDGVLCREPEFIEDDNKPEQMQDFILNAEPLYIPLKKVMAVITNRIEKYRPETETWLKNNGVEYDHLIMTNYKTADERRNNFYTIGGNGIFKAIECERIGGAWFIESSYPQAVQIKSIINSSVFCTDKQIMI